MRLNNKGFAITGFLYSIFAIFLVILSLLIISMTNSKITLERLKKDIKNQLDEPSTDRESFEHIFSYTGSSQTFEVPYSGWYEIELWGAQGGSVLNYAGGNGGYTKGKIYLEKNVVLNVTVGGEGKTGTAAVVAQYDGGYNGGGIGYVNRTGCTQTAASGGGSTDVRISNNLNSRIMVASGGGGAFTEYCGTGDNCNITGGSGGGLVGNTAIYASRVGFSDLNPTGGTQINGGMGLNEWTASTYSPIYVGSFGTGGSALNSGGSFSGGGGGYYGGASGKWQPGAGGSSFISGYAGVNAITSSSSLTPTNNTIHYSGKYFIDGEMQAGINEGNGKAKITYLSETKPQRINTKLNNVRYIKDCINGSSANNRDHWQEIQTISDGKNIAINKNIITDGTLRTDVGSKNLKYIINGDINDVYTEIEKSTLLCIIIDLEQIYDLDEIAVWHYWGDGRTYNNNVTSVSSDNFNWTTIISTTEPETANGKRVNAYSK